MKHLSMLLFAMMCSACTTLHYGYSAEAWNGLSEEEKKAAKAKYQPILDEKNSQQQGDPRDERTKRVIDTGFRHGR